MELDVISVERAQEIADASIVSGHIDGSGNLVLVNGAGEEINAGKTVDPLSSWPIGSVYHEVDGVSPAQRFGGTWDRFAKGRMLVGVDEADAQFDTPLETGGAKTVVLTAAQLAQHSHGVNDPGHIHGGGGDPPAIAGTPGGSANYQQAGNTDAALTGITIGNTGSNQPHENMSPYVTVYIWRRTA